MLIVYVQVSGHKRGDHNSFSVFFKYKIPVAAAKHSSKAADLSESVIFGHKSQKI
jgi:hypothetical protein